MQHFLFIIIQGKVREKSGTFKSSSLPNPDGISFALLYGHYIFVKRFFWNIWLVRYTGIKLYEAICSKNHRSGEIYLKLIDILESEHWRCTLLPTLTLLRLVPQNG